MFKIKKVAYSCELEMGKNNIYRLLLSRTSQNKLAVNIESIGPSWRQRTSDIIIIYTIRLSWGTYTANDTHQ